MDFMPDAEQCVVAPRHEEEMATSPAQDSVTIFAFAWEAKRIVTA